MSAVLFLAEVATPSMLDSLIGLARPNDQFLSLDAQASMRLRMQGHNAASIPPKLTALRAGRTVRSAIREALSCTDDRFADAVGPGLARLFSQLRSDGAHIKRSLERGNTSLIVLASDQHRYGNLIAEIARPYDIKTLVIQHGLPQSPVGFLPARADHYAVFGRTSAQFFHAAGVARERVHLVGLPRPSAETTSGTRDSILVPLQPGPEAANRAILRTIEEFQRSRLNVRTILRVHPGDRRTLALPNADVVAYWAPALRDVTVDRDRDATSTFARTRLLLTANSTLAVDAAAAGVPVAAFRSASLDDSPFFEGLPEVQDAASLGEALDSATSLNNSALLHATHEEAIALGRNLLDDLSR